MKGIAIMKTQQIIDQIQGKSGKRDQVFSTKLSEEERKLFDECCKVSGKNKADTFVLCCAYYLNRKTSE